MKIRFKKTIAVDVEKPHAEEIWSKTYNRWDEVRVQGVYESGGYACIQTTGGEYLLNVPVSSFEKVTEEKRMVSLG